MLGEADSWSLVGDVDADASADSVATHAVIPAQRRQSSSTEEEEEEDEEETISDDAAPVDRSFDATASDHPQLKVENGNASEGVSIDLGEDEEDMMATQAAAAFPGARKDDPLGSTRMSQKRVKAQGAGGGYGRKDPESAPSLVAERGNSEAFMAKATRRSRPDRARARANRNGNLILGLLGFGALSGLAGGLLLLASILRWVGLV